MWLQEEVFKRDNEKRVYTYSKALITLVLNGISKITDIKISKENSG